MEKLKEFLKMEQVGFGTGASFGFGFGDGSGDGSGDGIGYGIGDIGDGTGDGSGDGIGYGIGDIGYGTGGDFCDGAGDGYGNGYGNGTGIKQIGKNSIHVIDEIETIIYSVRNNIAKGAILNQDLTLTTCFIVKNEQLYAHGTTLKKAMAAMEEKLFFNMDVDERISSFLKEFELNKKYPAKLFFEWHFKLTRSCELGRNSFVKNHGINLKTDRFTVGEFINLTKDEYGGEIIKKLEEKIC